MDSKNGKVTKGLGTKLRTARKKAGLTQEEVADRADMHVNYYARIERGEINTSYEKLHKIAGVLKIKLF